MFKVVICNDGVPALKMISLDDDHETFYLSSDQFAVLFKDGGGEFVIIDRAQPLAGAISKPFEEIQKMFKVVFDGVPALKMNVYHWNNSDTLLENHPACAAFYPAETVKVSMAIQVVGVKDAI